MEQQTKGIRGRRPSPDPGEARTVNLLRSDWAYVDLYQTGPSVSANLREALGVLRRYRPAKVVGGELRFVQHEAKGPRRRPLPRKAIRAYAERAGLTEDAALYELVTRALKEVGP